MMVVERCIDMDGSPSGESEFSEDENLGVVCAQPPTVPSDGMGRVLSVVEAFGSRITRGDYVTQGLRSVRTMPSMAGTPLGAQSRMRLSTSASTHHIADAMIRQRSSASDKGSERPSIITIVPSEDADCRAARAELSDAHAEVTGRQTLRRRTLQVDCTGGSSPGGGRGLLKTPRRTVKEDPFAVTTRSTRHSTLGDGISQKTSLDCSPAVSIHPCASLSIGPNGSEVANAGSPKPTIGMMGLPPLLRRRSGRLKSFTESEEGERVLQKSTSGSSMSCTEGNVGLGSMDSLLDLEKAAHAEPGDKQRASILDFEHLFVQYYVEVKPVRASGFPASLRAFRCGGISVVPDAHRVANAWKAEAVECIWKYRQHCQARWPDLRMSKRALERQLDQELVMKDEIDTKRSRVLLTLDMEKVCHRLFWAIGDAVPPSRLLSQVETGVRHRLPECEVRCMDTLVRPPSSFSQLVLIATILLGLCLRLLLRTAFVVSSVLLDHDHGGGGKRHGHGQHHHHRQQAQSQLTEATPEELLDQLAARTLLVGGVANLWMLYVIALAFPLRSLHSPFRRDLGCLTAYSAFSLRLFRVANPLVALAVATAIGTRFYRLGLPILPTTLLAASPWDMRCLGKCLVLCSLLGLPVCAVAASWSVRSSLYSHHHLCMMLLFLSHMATAIGFACSLDVVRWGVLGAVSLVGYGVYLFYKYTSEFTQVKLHKAAQLQWACAHMVSFVLLLLAAALEVESGLGRVLIEFICDSQEIMPKKMCVKLMRG
eukprot:TRINITY_DN3423_c0_g6_i1.p1 TRINITY_DN3423_c0_g6~~TRINITY_DN3423_c0_g6_i1.p1  ORF type:complete len:767 (+),score=145.64 TRINITY_DN3423_c0_g6_i1:119-2419(+)